jgi:hypothetical protein
MPRLLHQRSETLDLTFLTIIEQINELSDVCIACLRPRILILGIFIILGIQTAASDTSALVYLRAIEQLIRHASVVGRVADI